MLNLLCEPVVLVWGLLAIAFPIAFLALSVIRRQSSDVFTIAGVSIALIFSVESIWLRLLILFGAYAFFVIHNIISTVQYYKKDNFQAQKALCKAIIPIGHAIVMFPVWYICLYGIYG